MDDVLSLIRSLLEDMQEPEEIVRPEAVQAEQEVADRAVEELPVTPAPAVSLTPAVQSPAAQTTFADPSAAPLPETSGFQADRIPSPQVGLGFREQDPARDADFTEASRLQRSEVQPVERDALTPADTAAEAAPSAGTPGIDVAVNAPSRVTPPNWVFPDKKTTASTRPVSTERAEAPHTEIADPLRFAAAAVTAVERERRENGVFNPDLNATVSSKQVTPNIRVETIIPQGFPVDTRDIFSRIDKEIQLPNEAGGDPFLAKQVELPPPFVGDSTEQAIAKHYASIQGALDLDQRNVLE